MNRIINAKHFDSYAAIIISGTILMMIAEMILEINEVINEI